MLCTTPTSSARILAGVRSADSTDALQMRMLSYCCFEPCLCTMMHQQKQGWLKADKQSSSRC